MKWLKALLLASTATTVLGLGGYTVPPGSPGYQHGNSSMAIQFDSHSLFVDGKRLFVLAGEFHPWRLPVPELWSDILQKMKAGGFNAVSIYIHWGLVEGKAGTLNWEYYRSLELFYEVAKRVGIYVIARPGPYINAETTGGGLPGWLTKTAATARSNETEVVEAWQLYVQQFAEVTSKYQYPDGPVIAVQSENEFYVSQEMNPTATEAMVLLENALRKNGISKVPITCNDVYPSGNFASGEGQVDIYGFDSYPGSFDCTNPSFMPELPNYFTSGHASVDPWGLMYLAEFQGGSLDGWGGPGYDNCEALLGTEFSNVFYKANVGFGATAMSFYMAYGGTNWGNLAYPGVYTSYDYAASIRESRILAPKFSEIKLQGLFYHASPSLLTTSIAGQGSDSQFTTNAGVYVTNLASAPTNYYIVRQVSNNFTTPISTSIKVNTTVGQLTVPQFGGQITLDGRETKILVSEYPFGSSTLRYSTAEVLTQTTISSTDYLVLYVPKGQSLEAVIVPKDKGTPVVSGASSVKAKASGNTVVITGSPSGISVVKFGRTIVVVTDKSTASTFWQPHTVGSSFDVAPDVPSVIVAGPYLVRNATIASSTLSLVGDVNATTTLTVLAAPTTVSSVTWNGAPVKVSKSNVGLTGTISGPVSNIPLPNLQTANWKSSDSLPEISPSFDDSTWTIANKTTVQRIFKPYAGKYVLFADEYGFHSGNFVFRGYFNGSATGVNISVQGGTGFGFSAFLNGHFLASGQGLNGADTVNTTLNFPSDTIADSNVLTVVLDSNGLDEDWNSNDQFKSPRGIRGYTLVGGGDFDVWKVTGNLGGEDFPDNVRGPYNEGGLWAERFGAVLPGYDDSQWNSSSPFDGISQPGIQIYRTSFDLNIPTGLDVPLGIEFTPTLTSNYRSVLYVNGWQFGRFISNLGPQTTFPVPEGVLNLHGTNEVALTLWSLDEQGAKVSNLQLVSLGIFSSGKEVVSTSTVTSPTFQQLRPHSL